MKNTSRLIGLLAITVIIVISITACGGSLQGTCTTCGGSVSQGICTTCGNSQQPDIWTFITSYDQMHGTWIVNDNQRISMKEFIENLPGGSWDTADESLYAGITVEVSINQTITINTVTRTNSPRGNIIYSFSGNHIATVWPELKLKLEKIVTPVNRVIIDFTYTIILGETGTYSANESTINQFLTSGIQINQNGTKLKFPAGTAFPVEVTFIKQ